MGSVKIYVVSGCRVSCRVKDPVRYREGHDSSIMAFEIESSSLAKVCHSLDAFIVGLWQGGLFPTTLLIGVKLFHVAFVIV